MELVDFRRAQDIVVNLNGVIGRREAHPRAEFLRNSADGDEGSAILQNGARVELLCALLAITGDGHLVSANRENDFDTVLLDDSGVLLAAPGDLRAESLGDETNGNHRTVVGVDKRLFVRELDEVAVDADAKFTGTGNWLIWLFLDLLISTIGECGDNQCKNEGKCGNEGKYSFH